jgi:hypothetical protein
MIMTVMAGVLILASTPPKPAPPPPPPPSGPGHIKTFDGTSDAVLAKPATPPTPSGGLAPAPRPPAPLLLPAIQKARESATRSK